MAVEYLELGEVLKPQKNLSIKKSEYSEYGLYPIIDQSQKLVAGYSNNDKLVQKNLPCIVVGDHTRTVKYCDYYFIPGDSGTKVFMTDNYNFNIKYVYYNYVIYFAPPHELQPDFANRTRLIIPTLFNPPDSLTTRGI
jgi:type I restriction enzyme S subunit